MQCPLCKSDHFHRRHRSFAERLRYAAIYECAQCHCRDLEYYAEHFPRFSRFARCPECGGTALRVQHFVDPVDRLSRSALSFLQKLLHAPLLYCPFCRFQFYDLRPLLRARRGPASDTSPLSAAERSAPPSSARQH